MRKFTISMIATIFGALLLLSNSAFAQQHEEGHGQHSGAHGNHNNAAGNHGAMSGHSQVEADANTGKDMQLVHQLFVANESIRRTVTELSNGVRTVTESDDPEVATAIKAHVLSMDSRLDNGDIFNVLNSSNIPEIFENADRIQTTIEETAQGVVFTQTSDDPNLVSVLQDHAKEVDELVASGMAAMHRGASGTKHQGGDHHEVEQ